MLALIALLMLLAVIALIALRAEKIRTWLAWPTPVSLLVPWLPLWEAQTAPAAVLTHALRLPLRLYAASP